MKNKKKLKKQKKSTGKIYRSIRRFKPDNSSTILTDEAYEYMTLVHDYEIDNVIKNIK